MIVRVSISRLHVTLRTTRDDSETLAEAFINDNLSGSHHQCQVTLDQLSNGIDQLKRSICFHI